MGRWHVGSETAPESAQSDNQPVMSTVARTAGLALRAEDVFAVLARETAVLKRFGVSRLALFGSAVRGEARPDSDLDFLVDFNQKTFRNYMGLANFLEHLFGHKVDLVIRETIKPVVRERVLAEAQDVPGL
jgi:predicted nucleotidyltransferase